MNELTNEPTHEQKFLLAVKSKGLYYHGSRKGKWSSDNKPAARILHGRGGGWGGGRRNNNIGMIGHASAEDTRFLMGSGGVLPRKRFEI